MKKSLLIAALAALTMGAQAQNQGKALFQKSPVKIASNFLKAPRHEASLEGTSLWGYYTGDIEQLGGLGSRSAGTFSVAMKVPGTGVTEGASICGFNVPISTATNMTDVSVFVVKDLIKDPIVTKAVDNSELKNASYIPVTLDEEYKIPEEGVYVGYTFTITKVEYQGDAYPILIDGTSTYPEQLYIKMGDGAFEDYSDKGFGALGLQLYLKGMQLNANDAHLSAIQETSALVNESTQFTAMMETSGSNGVQSFDYTVDLDGDIQEHHVDLAQPIQGGLYRKGIVNLPFDAPAEAKAFNAIFTITKVNGEENECQDNTFTQLINILLRKAKRVSVEEEFTGLGCGWCPRGLFAMGKMAEAYPDNYIGITVHNYGNNDPMRISNYWKGFSGSAPACFIDRRSGEIDPYYGSYNSIEEDFEFYNAINPEAEISLQAVYTDNNKTAVDITANVEMLTLADNVSVVYVLTADDLNNDSWKQANYYSSVYASQTGLSKNNIEEELQYLWDLGSSFVTTFNDVAIASSYNTSGKNLAPALTVSAAGENIEQTYKLTMPTKTALKNTIDTEKVNAVAMVIGANGFIMNAAKVKVENASANTGIKANETESSNNVVTRYAIDGTQLTAPQQGINIVRMANGKVMKVVVK